MSEPVAASARPSASLSASFSASPSRSRGRVLLQCGAALTAALLIIVFRDRLPDIGAMRNAAARAHPAWIGVVVLASAISMGAFARLQRRLLRTGGVRMSRRRAVAVTYAGNALSASLPAGPAVSVVYTFRQFRHGGATAQLATAVILVGGIVTTAAYSVIALLALLASPQVRDVATAALLVPAVAALAVAPVLVRRGPRARLAALGARAVRAVSRWRRVAPYVQSLREGRRALRPGPRDWAVLSVLAALNRLLDILALFAAARAVAIEIAPHEVALAYFAAQAAGSALPLLPGGLGALESSMAATLVALGAGLAPAGAAVAVYRLVSYVAVVAVGWLAWAGLRVPARTRRWPAAVGGAVLNGLACIAISMSPRLAPSASPHCPCRPLRG